MDCRCQVLDVDVQSYKVPCVTGNRVMMGYLLSRITVCKK